jgi:polyphosphate kinase
LCRLRPGVPGLSETIEVFGVVGRFLEHSRIYRFENGGKPAFYIGSADWMKRNLDNRMETIAPVLDPKVQRSLQDILDVYHADNATVWECGPDGAYARRVPPEGAPRLAAQEEFIRRARADEKPASARPTRKKR